MYSAVYWGCANTPPPVNGTGYYFAPHETDYSVLNPGDNWFWDASDPVADEQTIWSQYTQAYNRGSQFIFNVPPDRTGSINATIVQTITAFGTMINKTFQNPIASAAGLPISAPCADLSVVINFPADAAPWDQLETVEDLSPQLIVSYELQVMPVNGTSWLPITGDGIHGECVRTYIRTYASSQLKNGYRSHHWGACQ